jgi:hypothetical protein
MVRKAWIAFLVFALFLHLGVGIVVVAAVTMKQRTPCSARNLKLEYPVPTLTQSFEQMIRRAHSPAELPGVEVLDNSFLGDASLDSEGWAYVAIWSEAVTITARPYGPDYLITELIWGRP